LKIFILVIKDDYDRKGGRKEKKRSQFDTSIVLAKMFPYIWAHNASKPGNLEAWNARIPAESIQRASTRPAAPALGVECSPSAKEAANCWHFVPFKKKETLLKINNHEINTKTKTKV